MSPWAIAIGNIDGSNPPLAVFDQDDATPAPAPRQKPAPAERQRCPHCGAPMKLPDGPKPWLRHEDRELLSLLRAGRSRAEIAAALDRQASSVGSRLATLRNHRVNLAADDGSLDRYWAVP